MREKGVGLGQGSDGRRHRGLGAERRIIYFLLNYNEYMGLYIVRCGQGSCFPSVVATTEGGGCGSGVTNHGDGAVVGGAGHWDLLLMDGSVFPIPSSVYWNVWWWPWSMCSHQRWIMLVVGVLSMEVLGC